MMAPGNSYQDASLASLHPDRAFSPDPRRLLHYIQARSHKTIAIQSQFPGEGKTPLTKVLAECALHSAGLRVLVIDAVSNALDESSFKDFSPHSAVDNQSAPSIEVMVAKSLREGSALVNSPPADSPDPDTSRLISASDFQVGAYIRSVSDKHDLILIDCCSFASVTPDNLHPSILAHYSDSSLLVLSPQSLEQKALVSLKALITHQQLSPLGFVFNQKGCQ